MAWVPSLPPRQGVKVKITNPTESFDDGVVRYRVTCSFDPATTAFSEEAMKGAPFPEAEAVRRVTTACNDLMVIRRFSEFDSIFREFAGTKGVSPALPPLPEKKIFGNKDPKFVEQRRAAIEAFAQAVLNQHPRFTAHPSFLHVFGFNNLQLWFALADPDDTLEPPAETLRSVLSLDGEVLRSDAIRRAATTRNDAERRSCSRLLYYAVRSGGPGLQHFIYENARMALVTSAERAESDDSILWAGKAVYMYATVDASGHMLVARGDVRDALISSGMRTKKQAAMRSVAEAAAAVVNKGSSAAKQLYLTPAVRELVSVFLVRLQDVEATLVLVRMLIELAEALPTFKFINQQTFTANEPLHVALGAARDRARKATNADLVAAVQRAMEITKCDPEIVVPANVMAAAAATASDAPSAATMQRTTSAAALSAAAPTVSIGIAGAASGSGKPPPIPIPARSSDEQQQPAAVDDFLVGDEGDDGDGVDDFLDDGDDGDAAAGVDDFLGDDDGDDGDVDAFLDSGSDDGGDDGGNVDDFLADD